MRRECHIRCSNTLTVFGLTVLGLSVFGLMTAAGCTGCQDEAPESSWGLADRGQWERQDLHGPPGQSYKYRGRIGDRLFFSHAADVFEVMGSTLVNRHTSVAFSYTAAQGWRLEPSFEPVIANEQRYLTAEHIVELDGAHYFLSEEQGALYRSDDRAQSWKEVSLPPSFAEPYLGASDYPNFLTSDGAALFVVDPGEVGDKGALWRSRDGARSWTQIRDDLLSSHFSSGDGILAARLRVGRTESRAVMSTDSGETWTSIEADGERVNIGRPRWTRHQDHYIFPIFRGRSDSAETFPLGRAYPDGRLEWFDVAGPQSYIARLAEVDGQLFALTDDGELGQMSDDLTRFEPIPRPPGEFASGYHPYLTILSVGHGLLAVITDQGMWQTDDAGQNWAFVGHPYSNVGFVAEADDTLLVGGSEFQYRREDDGSWTWLDFATDTPIWEVDGCNQVFYGIDRTGGRIYELDAGTETGRLVWQDSQLPRRGVDRSLSVLCDAERTFVGITGARGLLRAVEVIDESEHTWARGGGLFQRDTSSGELTRFADSFPANVPPGVHSLIKHDESLWVLTGNYGVWRVDPNSGEWTYAHEGLPLAESHDQELVRGLHAGRAGLFAYSYQGIWRWRAGSWSPVAPEAIDAIASYDPETRSTDDTFIVGLAAIDNGLLVVTTDAVLVLNPDTGDVRNFDADFDHLITGVVEQPSGLYLTLWYGGLIRYVPRF